MAFVSKGNNFLVFWEGFMHPFISEDKLSIKIDKMLDDDFQKVHPIVFETIAQLNHIV